MPEVQASTSVDAAGRSAGNAHGGREKARRRPVRRSRATLLRAAAARFRHAPPLPPRCARPDVALIAEIKRRSPSKGDINPGLVARRAGARLRRCRRPRPFRSSPSRPLSAARAPTWPKRRRPPTLPLLRKDFIVDPLQIMEARALGASAVLLIARGAVARDAARGSPGSPPSTGSRRSSRCAPSPSWRARSRSGADVIGVNNRDLETLEIEPAVSERLLPLVPARSSGRVRERHQRAAGRRARRALRRRRRAGRARRSRRPPTARAAVGALAGVPRVGRG